MTHSLDDQIRSLQNSFTKVITDNVDHNIATIDGHGTFHGMGIIASTIANANHVINEIKIKRTDKLFKVEHLCNKNIAPIVPYQYYRTMNSIL